MVKYQVVLADPPWKYGDKLRMSDTARGSDDQYETMTNTDIARLSTRIDTSTQGGRDTLHTIAGFPIEDDAVLFLWTTNSFLVDGTSPGLCRVWGFKPKQIITWVKTKKERVAEANDVVGGVSQVDFDKEGDLEHVAATLNKDGLQFGMGHYTRGVTEHVILATKGTATKLVKTKSVRNVIFAPRTTHSAKPPEMYELIERLFYGPYLELFARERRPDWTSWGLELEPDSKP